MTQITSPPKQKITTFLTFNNEAEAAMNLYISVFANARVVSVSRMGEQFFSGVFEIEGQQFMVLNGGPHFSFSSGISLFVRCQTQAEVDSLWEKLTADGGKEEPCGWLKDRFGVSWQIIPTALETMFSDPNREKAGRAMNAMLQMKKIDIAALTCAFEGVA
jgi:predicted 3-demethylubiquinone-9 3-methyltransferase (glyoxalase superfamily)